MAVVDLGALGVLDFRWGVLPDTLHGESLEGRENVGTCFDGVCWAYDVGIGVADVGVGVGVLERGLVGVDWPGCDVDLGRCEPLLYEIERRVIYLFAQADRVSFQERIHVLPAVKHS